MKKHTISLLVVLLLVAAACGDEAEETTTTAAATTTAAPTPVEVFSWWTAGGEADGLAAMVEVFAAEYAQYTFENAAVAGGAGTNARAVLATRLAANDPPDSWQGHAGQELIGTYVAAAQLEPLNFLFEEQGWLEVMPATLIPLISEGDQIYSVPVNIHRANVMWYNPAVLETAGIEVPTTLEEFFAAADTLQAAGITPLAMGEAWTSMHLFEAVLLGTLGADGYKALWDGSGDWAGAEVTTAIDNFARMLSYTYEDASTLSWDQAAQLVVDGTAAFTIMGDWAEGYFKAEGLAPNEGFGWAPAPGTDGLYQFLSDSFVLPVGAPNRDGAIAWLTICGSQAGQDAFNPIKGSIPARTDGDVTLYDEYLQSAMADWAVDTVVGSLTHGVVANDNWKNEINTAIGLYLDDGDAAAFQAALATACATTGACA